MTLVVNGSEDLGSVALLSGASPTLTGGATAVAMVETTGRYIITDGHHETPALGGVLGTMTNYMETGNQASGRIHYWTADDIASMTGFELTFPGQSITESCYISLIYFNVNEFGYDATQDWSKTCSTCGAGSDLSGDVSIPTACVDGQYLHVMGFGGNGAYGSRQGTSIVPVNVGAGTNHDEGAYSVNTGDEDEGYAMPGLAFWSGAWGAVFYEADPDILVTPDPVTITVTAPAHTETGAYPDITEHDNQAAMEVFVPIPTIVVTHPQQIPLVGVHEQMPGRVPMSSGLTVPMLTQVQKIPVWTEASGTLSPADHDHTGDAGDGGVILHASTGGQTVDDHHSQVHDHTGGGDDGGLLTAATIPIVDAGSLIAATEVEAALQEVATDIVAIERITPVANGHTLEATQQTVTEAGGTVSLNFDASPSGNIDILFGGVSVTLTAGAVALTAGTDVAPQLNYVYVTEAAGTATLAKSTAGWPTAEDFAPVATVLVQSAASVASYGVYKHHAWTDHIVDGVDTGHLAHINKKLRALQASWISGCAGSALVISSPNAHMTTGSGVVYQLHEHTMPALDMSTDGAYLINEPTTANLRITSFDGITQDASGGAINNKWFTLVLWGVVSENSGDCRLFINLPTSTYNNEALAQADASSYNVYTIPSDYTGTGFLIAAYTVQGKTSGAWVESLVTDLRGLAPAVSPGSGSPVSDHGGLAGLGDDDHTQYLLDKASGGAASEVPVHDHSAAGEAGTIAHSVTTGQGTDDHHAEAHTVASTGPHAQSGLAAGEFLRASAAAAFDFAAIQDADVPASHSGSTHAAVQAAAEATAAADVDADIITHAALGDAHHAEAHTVASTGPHAQSGLTAGHFLRASAATAFDFAAIGDADVPSSHSGSTHAATQAAAEATAAADVDADISTHEGAADPHAGYLLNAEKYTDAEAVSAVEAANPLALAGNLDAGAGVDVTGNITVTGTVDGVDIATRDALIIPDTTVTTKGDLLTTTGSATMTRRAVGTDDQVLTADAAEADGVKWATPAGGAGTPASSVVTEEAFGQADAVGVGTDYARDDHTHGTPADPEVSIIQTIYPVGAIYISTLTTNPNTLLGFGTWTAFGAGRVLIGEDGGTYTPAEDTGGAATDTTPTHTHTGPSHDHTRASHTHTEDYLPSHSHSGGSHNHTERVRNASSGGSTTVERRSGWSTGSISSALVTLNTSPGTGSASAGSSTSGGGGTANTGSGGTGATGADGTGATGADGDETIDIIQPYIVVHMWKRTA